MRSEHPRAACKLSNSTFNLICIIALSLIIMDCVPVARAGRLLIANHEGDNILSMDESTLQITELIPAGLGGLSSPDSMVLNPFDGFLYVSSGKTVETSAILVFDITNGTFVRRFDSGGNLFRPYGLEFDWSRNEMFVSSFLSDALLVYDAKSGKFKRTLLTGNRKPGGLNGPNGLMLGPNGKLYCSTEGSYAVDGQPVFGLPTQILEINTTTGESSVFIDQTTPSNASLGFTNYLGMEFAAATGRMYISDFGNDIYVYDFNTRRKLATLSTSYTGAPATNAIGGIAITPRGLLYTTGFIEPRDTGNPGAILRFDANSGKPLPGPGQSGAVLIPTTPTLRRPIGVTYVPY